MELLTIGKIVKPQGVKGEVKIQLYTEYEHGIKNLTTVYIDNIGKKNIKTVSVRFGFAYILFEGVSSREDAENLRGLEVNAPKNDMKIELPDTFYIEDIIGSQVFDENQKLMGVIENVEKYGAADVWMMRMYGRIYSFPYISSIVKEVYPEQKKIIINKKEFDVAKICE